MSEMDYDDYIKFATDIYYDGMTREELMRKLIARGLEPERSRKIYDAMEKLYRHNKELREAEQIAKKLSVQRIKAQLLNEKIEREAKERLAGRNLDDDSHTPPIY